MQLIITLCLVLITICIIIQTYFMFKLKEWNIEQGIKQEISSDLHDKYIRKVMERMCRGERYGN